MTTGHRGAARRTDPLPGWATSREAHPSCR